MTLHPRIPSLILLLAGALPATLLALLSEALFEGVDWLLRRRRSGPA